jgi:hypothetical protein
MRGYILAIPGMLLAEDTLEDTCEKMYTHDADLPEAKFIGSTSTDDFKFTRLLFDLGGMCFSECQSHSYLCVSLRNVERTDRNYLMTRFRLQDISEGRCYQNSHHDFCL